MTMIELRSPASEDMIRYQLTMLYAQCQLLGDHAIDHERCACEMKDETSEFCIPKHCIAIAEGYCTETIAMTDNPDLKNTLARIKNGTSDLRREYEDAVARGKKPPYAAITEFAREARKALEPFLFSYKGTVAVKQVEETVALLSNYCFKRGENMHELHQADPLLAEIASQICQTGACFARGDKKGKLPVCSPAQREARERCLLAVKERNVEAGCKPEGTGSKKCPSAFAVCTTSIGCRLGRAKES